VSEKPISTSFIAANDMPYEGNAAKRCLGRRKKGFHGKKNREKWWLKNLLMLRDEERIMRHHETPTGDSFDWVLAMCIDS
jgi:hypothetical protein